MRGSVASRSSGWQPTASHIRPGIAMTAILALDTSADACSVALRVGGSVEARFELVPREHTLRILPMVDEVLAAAGMSLSQLDAIAFGRGPGSFTGVRIAAGVAQGLAFGADLPVVPVSSLAALAQGWLRENPQYPAGVALLVAVDARMDELYYAGYRVGAGGELVPLDEEALLAPDSVRLPAGSGPVVALGSGWAYGSRIPGYDHDVWHAVDTACQVNAVDVAWLGERGLAAGKHCPPELAQPVYLRNEVSWKKVAG